MKELYTELTLPAKDKKLEQSTIESYAIEMAIEHLSHSYEQSHFEIVNENTIPWIWNAYPVYRQDLFRYCLEENKRARSMESTGWGVKPKLSRKYTDELIDYIYKKVENETDTESVTMKSEIVAITTPDFDYYSECFKYKLDPDMSEQLQIWWRSGLDKSRNPDFFKTAWDSVGRKPGAIDDKIDIINSAFKNNALPIEIVEQTSKSSSVNIKRLITSLIKEKMESSGFGRRYIYYNQVTDYEVRLDKQGEEKRTELEKMAMLFTACEDSNVVQNLMQVLGRDNLPWLIPSASKHPYLAKSLQQLIDSAK